ncbi:MAG: hypothetical protein LBB48_03930, partial [Treponema sp.]|nr:hypothetical protein [Treponema sp.]
MKDFVPPKEGEFLTFARRFVAAVEKYAELLGIPQSVVARLKAELAAYEAAYEKCGSANAGRLDREDRKEKREILEADIRKTKKAYIDADPLGVVTDEIWMDFGLPPVDPSKTNVPTPTEIVAFTLEHGGYLQVAVRHPARPPRYNGAVAFYKVAEPEPVKFEELTSSKLLTRMIETLTFKEGDLSKTLHIALCWENEKGELGPP